VAWRDGAVAARAGASHPGNLQHLLVELRRAGAGDQVAALVAVDGAAGAHRDPAGAAARPADLDRAVAAGVGLRRPSLESPIETPDVVFVLAAGKRAAVGFPACCAISCVGDAGILSLEGLGLAEILSAAQQASITGIHHRHPSPSSTTGINHRHQPPASTTGINLRH
jgi:hypothetical protein